MKLKKFKEQYDGAPFLLEEFAEGAIQVTDHKELATAAKTFLDAQADFYRVLNDIKIEIG